MNAEDLSRLLEKYYNGDSNDEEEAFLREYFKGNDIPQGYEAEKEIFSYYSGIIRVPEASLNFEEKIIERIDEVERMRNKGTIRRIVFPVLSAAAGLIFLVGSYFFFIHSNEPRDTFSDPEIAYAETVKILYDISSKLNQNTRKLEPIAKMSEMTAKSFGEINKSKIFLDERLQNIGYLQIGLDISDPAQKMINNK